MAKIQDLLKYYPQIIEIFHRTDIQKVFIFKGLTSLGEHDLNILIIGSRQDGPISPICMADVKGSLTLLLGCTVCVTDKQSMLPEFYERLNPSNSFELSLSDTLENRDQFFGSLQRIFGTEWEFVTREPYDREVTEEEEQRYREQMESMRPWFEQDEREAEADEQEAATSRSKSVGFFTQPTALQDLSATVQIIFVCGGVTITRNLSLHNVSPAVTSKPDLADKLATACSELLRREGVISTPPPASETVCGW